MQVQGKHCKASPSCMKILCHSARCVVHCSHICLLPARTMPCSSFFSFPGNMRQVCKRYKLRPKAALEQCCVRKQTTWSFRSSTFRTTPELPRFCWTFPCRRFSTCEAGSAEYALQTSLWLSTGFGAHIACFLENM